MLLKKFLNQASTGTFKVTFERNLNRTYFQKKVRVQEQKSNILTKNTSRTE